MAAVTGGDGAVHACVDRWEARIVTRDGASTRVVASEPGVAPSIGVSFDEARALCAATPLVDPEHGVYGRKHLVTSSEWEDAADGQVGTGGLAWPYGDTFDPSACATVDARDNKVLTSAELTGARPRCVSAFGVFDQSGNVWEWADPQQDLDIDGWLAAAAQAGVPITSGADDTLVVPPGAPLTHLRLDVTGIQPPLFRRGEAGVLEVDPGSFQSRGRGQGGVWRGYLLLEHGSDAALLPVVVRRLESDGPGQLFLARDQDNQPVADKRGGSWYSGRQGAAGTRTPYLGHMHDFEGSIGFRCAGEPWRPDP